MRCLSFVLVLSLSAPLFGQVSRLPKPADISKQSTHEQVALLKISKDKPSCRLTTFALNSEGQIVAGLNAGGGKGEIRIVDGEGKKIRAWDVAINPEAVNVAPDGTVLVAGDGKMFRYSISGKKMQEMPAPHFKHLKGSAEVIRKQVIDSYKNRAKIYDRSITLYETRIAALKKKKEPTATDKRLLKAYETSITRLREYKKKYANQPLPSKKIIDQRVELMIKSKTGISSISSDGKNVYVATRALKGYGFAVWKTDAKFGNAKQIITDLRGCCGQMDVQCCPNGLYVAENARHRVACFDVNGKEVLTWGKRDRKGVTGFTSCCNPMNVCFGKNGDVYTAESNTGRIKRYSSKGKFLDYVGDVKLVPGCKKVSIAVTPDTKRVYMLDITRNHIIVMERKSAAAATSAQK